MFRRVFGWFLEGFWRVFEGFRRDWRVPEGLRGCWKVSEDFWRVSEDF